MIIRRRDTEMLIVPSGLYHSSIFALTCMILLSSVPFPGVANRKRQLHGNQENKQRVNTVVPLSLYHRDTFSAMSAAMSSAISAAMPVSPSLAPSSSTTTLKLALSSPLLEVEDPVMWEDLASSFRSRNRPKSFSHSHSHTRSHSYSISSPKIPGVTLSRVVSGVWKKDLKPQHDVEDEDPELDPQTPALGIGAAAAASWWGEQPVPRPWSDPPKKSPSVLVPEEQTEGWTHTREVRLIYPFFLYLHQG
jgi:hypothetical protein